VEPRPSVNVLLLGADDSLAALLRDVFAEVGIALSTGEAGSARVDLVLVHIQRGESMLGALQSARDGTYPAPVFVLVPFFDERMIQRALRLGARGCFALGQPLEALCRMVLEMAPPQGRARSLSASQLQGSEPKKVR
jgi:DNA-binding NarL/FixJ family response regulator